MLGKRKKRRAFRLSVLKSTFEIGRLVGVLVAAVAISAILGDFGSSHGTDGTADERACAITGEGTNTGANGTTSHGAAFTRSAGSSDQRYETKHGEGE